MQKVGNHVVTYTFGKLLPFDPKDILKGHIAEKYKLYLLNFMNISETCNMSTVI